MNKVKQSSAGTCPPSYLQASLHILDALQPVWTWSPQLVPAVLLWACSFLFSISSILAFFSLHSRFCFNQRTSLSFLASYSLSLFNQSVLERTGDSLHSSLMMYMFSTTLFSLRVQVLVSGSEVTSLNEPIYCREVGALPGSSGRPSEWAKLFSLFSEFICRYFLLLGELDTSLGMSLPEGGSRVFSWPGVFGEFKVLLCYSLSGAGLSSRWKELSSFAPYIRVLMVLTSLVSPSLELPSLNRDLMRVLPLLNRQKLSRLVGILSVSVSSYSYTFLELGGAWSGVFSTRQTWLPKWQDLATSLVSSLRDFTLAVRSCMLLSGSSWKLVEALVIWLLSMWPLAGRDLLCRQNSSACGSLKWDSPLCTSWQRRQFK